MCRSNKTNGCGGTMGIGAEKSAMFAPKALRKLVVFAALAAAISLQTNTAMAQIPGFIPDEPAPAKTTAKPVTVADEKKAAAQPTGSAAEDLPWLATTTPGEAAPASGATKPSPSQQPAAAAKAPPAKPGDPKTAAATPKCEEQQENSCRAMKSCAWVAAMPTADGKTTPARCAERKVFATESDKKPKAAATKPKPKPERAATAAPAAPAATPEPANLQSETKPAAKPETAGVEPATTPAAAPPPPVQAQVKEQTATNPVADVAPAAAVPVPDAAPAVAKEAAAPSAPVQAPAATAAAPPTMLPRGPIPFLPPAASTPDAPNAQPRSEAAPSPSTGATSVASGTDEQSPPTESGNSISIPGLVISD